MSTIHQEIPHISGCRLTAHDRRTVCAIKDAKQYRVATSIQTVFKIVTIERCDLARVIGLRRKGLNAWKLPRDLLEGNTAFWREISKQCLTLDDTIDNQMVCRWPEPARRRAKDESRSPGSVNEGLGSFVSSMCASGLLWNATTQVGSLPSTHPLVPHNSRHERVAKCSM